MNGHLMQKAKKAEKHIQEVLQNANNHCFL